VPAIELTKVKGTWFVRNENLLIELDKAWKSRRLSTQSVQLSDFSFCPRTGGIWNFGSLPKLYSLAPFFFSFSSLLLFSPSSLFPFLFLFLTALSIDLYYTSLTTHYFLITN
jgi:hypothetical protein